jgi:hypothetical protein
MRDVEYMRDDVHKAKVLKQELEKSRRGGIACRGRAHWIGLLRYVMISLCTKM